MIPVSALCDNRDCSGFLDSRAEEFVDREDSGRIVTFCADCAKYVRRTADSRYQPVPPPTKGDSCPHREAAP